MLWRQNILWQQYWDRRITLGRNTFFHQWNTQSQKNVHCKELRAHYLLSQFVMPLFLPAGCASLSSSKEHWHIFSLHRFGDNFTAPFENRWEICIIWIHKHMICTRYSWYRFAHPFLQPSLYATAFQSKGNWTETRNGLQFAIWMVLPEDNKTSLGVCGVLLKARPQSDFPSSTRAEHKAQPYLMGDEVLGLERPSKWSQ